MRISGRNEGDRELKIELSTSCAQLMEQLNLSVESFEGKVQVRSQDQQVREVHMKSSIFDSPNVLLPEVVRQKLSEVCAVSYDIIEIELNMDYLQLQRARLAISASIIRSSTEVQRSPDVELEIPLNGRVSANMGTG